MRLGLFGPGVITANRVGLRTRGLETEALDLRVGISTGLRSALSGSAAKAARRAFQNSSKSFGSGIEGAIFSELTITPARAVSEFATLRLPVTPRTCTSRLPRV